MELFGVVGFSAPVGGGLVSDGVLVDGDVRDAGVLPGWLRLEILIGVVGVGGSDGRAFFITEGLELELRLVGEGLALLLFDRWSFTQHCHQAEHEGVGEARLEVGETQAATDARRR